MEVGFFVVDKGAVQMSLKPCKSCKHSVDATAKVCPSCGVKNPGLTAAQQVLGLLLLVVFILVAVSMCSGPGKQESVAKVAQMAAPSAVTHAPYTLTKDDFRQGMPRKVEVTLPRRLSDTELAAVAKSVRDDTKFKPEKTFIGFRVEGQTDQAYWANASFDPEYRFSLIGMGEKDYQTLKTLDLKAYPDKIGSWMQDGALGHVKVLYKRNKKYAIDSIFPDGGKSTTYYRAKDLKEKGLRLDEPDNGFGEYYIVDAKGNLQGWSENGMYLTLPPNLPVQ
jgi:hypothetical protein